MWHAKAPPLKHRYSRGGIPKQKGQTTHALNCGGCCSARTAKCQALLGDTPPIKQNDQTNKNAQQLVDAPCHCASNCQSTLCASASPAGQRSCWATFCLERHNATGKCCQPTSKNPAGNSSQKLWLFQPQSPHSKRLQSIARFLASTTCRILEFLDNASLLRCL